jgi:hypothetical protein
MKWILVLIAVLCVTPAAQAQLSLAPPAPVGHPAIAGQAHKAHVPTPHPRPASAGLDAFAATSAPPPKPAAAGSAPAGTLTAAAVQQNPFALIQKFSVDDLNAALLDAQGQNPPDDTAIQCYTALIPVVQAGILNPLPASPGYFQLAQKARDIKAMAANFQSPTGPLASLNRACAAWVLDGVNMVLSIGAKAGLIAGSGGLAGVLPFSLPIPLPGLLGN